MSVAIEDIREAAQRLAGVVLKTPLLRNRYLDERLGAEVFIKPECLQHIGAFKFRGAYNRLCRLDGAQRRLGVVAYSSGNHAQGVALAARLLNMPATIVMPADAPPLKLEQTQRLGAIVHKYDRATESREDIAAAIAARSGATLVPAFDDYHVIAGQGTCALELLDELDNPERLEIFLTPCGGGGLLAGTSTAVKALARNAAVYGVEQENYDDHLRSLQSGARVRVPGTEATMCDALMATTPGELTWPINYRNVDGFLVVSEDEVACAVAWAFRYLKLVVEPGGVVALAALLAGKLDVRGRSVALVLSGGNVDPRVFSRCLERFPAPD